jgi:hypothetical protein
MVSRGIRRRAGIMVLRLASASQDTCGNVLYPFSDMFDDSELSRGPSDESQFSADIDGLDRDEAEEASLPLDDSADASLESGDASENSHYTTFGDADPQVVISSWVCLPWLDRSVS